MGISSRELAVADAPALADLMTRIEADHPTGFCLGQVEVRELMSHKPDAVFEGAYDGDDLVAYTTVMPGVPREAGQRFILFGDVDPSRLGEGIGTLMLARSLDRSRVIHAADAPDVPARFSTTVLAGRRDQADLVAAAGMRPGRHTFLMVADLGEPVPLPQVPVGIRVGAFDAQQGEELRMAHNEAFSDHPDSTPISAEFWATFMVRAAHDRHHLSLVARDESGSVAAYVFAHEYAVPPSGGPGPELHVPYVGTLPRHRRRGLAGSLLSRVLALGREAGYVTASLNVDTANPTGALGLYERAGFRQSYRQDAYHLDEQPLLSR
jgi:mycothiol synthase